MKWGDADIAEEAPDQLLALSRNIPEQKHWKTTLKDQEQLKEALGLLNSGLVSESAVALHSISRDKPLYFALYTQIFELINPIEAHDSFHKYLNKHPPSTYTDNMSKIISLAYPEKYWDVVQEEAADYSYDPRIFHGLIREESSFNPEIVSWAGAKGLSQLMPATAKEVAGWLGITVTKTNIVDPRTNIKIGSRYLEHLHQQYNGNSFLAVAAYNAGPGNVRKWLNANGPLPTDAWVETITIRETRGYVKRVLGTYQLYRYFYDDEKDPFPDYTSYNRSAELPK